MNKVVIIDRAKSVQIDGLQMLFSNCGKIQSIQQEEHSEFVYFIVEYENEIGAQTAIFMNNSIVDNSIIEVEPYASFYEQHPEVKGYERKEECPQQTNQSNVAESISVESDDSINEKKESKREKFNQMTHSAMNQFQSFLVDCAVETRNVMDKLRGKEQFPEYNLPETYTHSESFEKKTFTIQQQKAPTPEINSSISSDDIFINDNNLKKKPLPPIPQKK